ncbi:hypothetical protein RhiJN_16399 [Ceratobasidium sp. AG-Ba]|nr:hypothetical protein RhiJN_16399 [Ceratobasidium sp. AG-Ba]
MDSTSQRNINFSSMHVMANTQNAHQQLYLAVKSTTDHTSETRVTVLKQSLEDICDTMQRAPKCSIGPNTTLAASDIARKLCGANGDHAKDQLKVAELEKQWKINSWAEHLGNLAHLNLGDAEAEDVFQKIDQNSEASSGSAKSLLVYR